MSEHRPTEPVGLARRPKRRFGDEEISDILTRAAEMQERSEVVTHGGGRGLTLEELRQVAEEAGIDPRFVELAATHADAPERLESKLAGGAYSWHHSASVEGEVEDRDRDRILGVIRSVMGHHGRLEDLYGRMEWRNDAGGPLVVGVLSRDGKTEIDVSAVKAREATALFIIGVSFGGIFGGAFVSGLLGISGAMALPLIGAAGVVSYGAARLAWKLRSRWWERRIARLVERVSSVVQEVAALPSPGVGGES